ncbi:serine--tRNA ligase [soil metagenome]
MLDVRSFRDDPAAVRAALARRHDDVILVQLDRAGDLDGQRRQLTARRDAVREQVNYLSEQVGTIRRSGDATGTDSKQLQQRARELRAEAQSLDDECKVVDAEQQALLLEIPNVPHPDVPDGRSGDDNPIVTGPVGMPDFFAEHQRVPHWETGAVLGILDGGRAVKISGAMFSMQRGLGATMARGLCQLALDRNADVFEEIRPPTLVSTETLTASGQLPKFADDAYSIERDNLWCSPTAEVPLTSIYAGEILTEAVLPLRLMAATASYRRESGAAGRDTRGMLRVHEFDKVEILALSTPEQAPELLSDLCQRAEATIATLELPYRTVEICTGDLGQSHHRSFDIEVYAPGCDQWLEVSSVSWFSDYQARRANIRTRRAGRKGTEMVHTLNGSALAVPRVWAAIVENHRQPDGSVRVPEALRPYMRGASSIRSSGAKG